MLAKQLVDESYVPSYKGILIPQLNADGTIKKHRGITPLDSRDWIVQRILLSELNRTIGDHAKTDSSYGREARKDETNPRSPSQCCKTIGSRRKELPVAFRADLVDFFPSVCRLTLLNELKNMLPSNWNYLWLLEKIVNTDSEPPSSATATQVTSFWPKGLGVHQGTVIAPFFANIVMAPWDRQWEGKVPLFRYVDDWLILGDTPSEISNLSEEMVKSLPPGIKCHLDNPKKCDLYVAGTEIDFLGLNITGDGVTRPSLDAFTKHKTILLDRRLKSTNVVDLAMSLIQYNDAWKNYYSDAGLTQPLKLAADKRVATQIDEWLKSKGVSQNASIHIKKLLQEFKPQKSAKSKDSISFGLTNGEIAPCEIDESISKIVG